MGRQVPIVDYLVLEDGDPYLRANECTTCGSLYFDRRNGCGKCGGREFTTRRLADTGKVRTFTIVHRAARGIPTPYVSTVVDLDGGGMAKANLVEIPPDPDDIELGMSVRITTFVVDEDDNGDEAVSFGFAPDQS